MLPEQGVRKHLDCLQFVEQLLVAVGDGEAGYVVPVCQIHANRNIRHLSPEQFTDDGKREYSN